MTSRAAIFSCRVATNDTLELVCTRACLSFCLGHQTIIDTMFYVLSLTAQCRSTWDIIVYFSGMIFLRSARDNPYLRAIKLLGVPFFIVAIDFHLQIHTISKLTPFFQGCARVCYLKCREAEGFWKFSFYNPPMVHVVRGTNVMRYSIS